MLKSEFVPGEVYQLDSYLHPERPRAVVQRVLPELRSWYDDHQDGGHLSVGSVVVKVLDELGGVIVESLEYASEHWDPVD